MLFHAMVMVQDIVSLLASNFLPSLGAHHVHVHGDPSLGYATVSTKHLVIRIFTR